ncbi:MAG: Arc family DNA binding domain-containing protein [Bryobacterales bacterium]|nr:Arc family DNA binding domain-containing protein [Bryobacterales bacterium]
MAEKKSFLIRMDAELLEALRRWADDDLRSLNGQIEYVLRSAVNDAGRTPRPGKKRPPGGKSEG